MLHPCEFSLSVNSVPGIWCQRLPMQKLSYLPSVLVCKKIAIQLRRVFFAAYGYGEHRQRFNRSFQLSRLFLGVVPQDTSITRITAISHLHRCNCLLTERWILELCQVEQAITATLEMVGLVEHQWFIASNNQNSGRARASFYLPRSFRVASLNCCVQSFSLTFPLMSLVEHVETPTWKTNVDNKSDWKSMWSTQMQTCLQD